MSTANNNYAPPQAPAVPVKLGHPPGLYVLFGAEMWERFSYYGMRALLILYVTKHLHFTKADGKLTYATYTGLVYFTPLIGGILADRVFGQRKAILIGGILMAIGHFVMAIESQLFLALSLLIIGNGFFKPNISTMVGNLYPQGDDRRDGAYTIFYFGINLGASIAPLACGALAENSRFGWHYGFGLAGVGMVLGLISFLCFQKYLIGGFMPSREKAGTARLMAMDWVQVIVAALLFVALAYGSSLIWPTIQQLSRKLVPVLLVCYGIAMIAVFMGVFWTRKSVKGENWQRVAVILLVAAFTIVFWMAFEQAGSTMTLFADSKTDRHLFGGEFPASYFQSVNPILILALAPIFAIIWTKVDQSRFKLTSTAKMGIGLILLGVGCMIMSQADRTSRDGLIGPQWLVIVYLFFTLGEICLSPIGLSLVNKLAPAKLASLMMAVWFVATAIGNYLAGTLEDELKHYHINLWVFLIATSIIPGLLLLALTGPLKKMGHGRI